jgi:hypothetical protein
MLLVQKDLEKAAVNVLLLHWLEIMDSLSVFVIQCWKDVKNET